MRREEIRNYDQYDYVLINNELESSAEPWPRSCGPSGCAGTGWRPQIRPILDTFERIMRGLN